VLKTTATKSNPLKMNCKNCTCGACVNDRQRTDLKKHRLQVIRKWLWNYNPHEAAKSMLHEVAAGRGGNKREWALEIEAELPTRDSQAVLALIGKVE